MNSLAHKAIAAALKCDWNEAIEINSIIVKDSPDDIDALNRLARAYAESNRIKEAKKYAKKALLVDPFNQIAQKSLSRWSKGANGISSHVNDNLVNPSAFLEEPGKTKIVNLLNLGSDTVLESLNNADEVKISAHSHRVCVTTTDGKYIGKLPDDLSARLRTLVKGGNQYKAYIKSLEKDIVKVFIREVSKGRDYTNTPSFPSEKIEYVSYAPPELVSSDKPYAESYDE